MPSAAASEAEVVAVLVAAGAAEAVHSTDTWLGRVPAGMNRQWEDM